MACLPGDAGLSQSKIVEWSYHKCVKCGVEGMSQKRIIERKGTERDMERER